MLGCVEYVSDNTDCDDSDQFIYPGGPPVRIFDTPPAYYSTLQAAYDAVLSGYTIQSKASVLNEDAIIDLNKTVKIIAGYNCAYSAITGQTTLNGNVSISEGKLIIDDGQLHISRSP